MLPSSPPPDPRKPGLAACGKLAHRLAGRDVLRRWCRLRNVSERDLAAIGGMSARRIADILHGHAPVPLDLIFALADRDGLDVLDEIRALILQRRSA
jgi:antitoxin component HigA of HigAB toxin-antitoxin module